MNNSITHLQQHSKLLIAFLIIQIGGCDIALAKDTHAQIVFLLDENEYKTECTLPAFAKRQLDPHGFSSTFIHADPVMPNYFPGVEALEDADLLILSVRRRSLPKSQLNVIRSYLDAGKPLVAVRTSSHAFDVLEQVKPGLAEWETFDADVLGGNYHGHFPTDQSALVEVADSAAHHPILAGIPGSFQWTTHGALYRVAPLRKGTTVLMYGRIEDQSDEPVAWTHSYRGGRVFYTSLGHPDDFDSDGFNRMLVGAVFWCLRLDLPDRSN